MRNHYAKKILANVTKISGHDLNSDWCNLSIGVKNIGLAPRACTLKLFTVVKSFIVQAWFKVLSRIIVKLLF